MKLVVNADDFGLTSGVNRGVVDCFLAGYVSSATLLVNTTATKEAVEIARPHPGLGVGLHFNLMLGAPLSLAVLKASPRPSMGAAGSRDERRRREGSCGGIKRGFLAQLERFRSFDLPPTHVDSRSPGRTIPPPAEARMIDLTYEDLCRAPADRMVDIASFLELDPAPLRATDYSHVESANVKFRHELERGSLQRMEELIGRELETRGYRLMAAEASDAGPGA